LTSKLVHPVLFSPLQSEFMEPLSETMDNQEQTPKRLKQGVLVLLLASFFLNAFPHVNAIKDIFFVLALIGFLVLVVKKRIRASLASPLSLPLVLLLVWAFITSVSAYEKGDSFDSLFSHLFKYLILLIVTANVIDNHTKIRWLIRSFIVSTLCFCIGAVVYYYGIQSNPWSARLGFSAAAHNIICFGANLAVIYSIYEFRVTNSPYVKPLAAASALVFIATTYLTQSRGGILALAASVICLFLMEKKIKILFPLLLIIGVGLMVSPIKDRFLDFQSFSNQHRIGATYYYLEVFKDHPVMGIGYAIDIFDNEMIYASAAYFERIPEVYRKDIYTGFPHSMFLSIGVRMGIVGVGLYLYLLAVFFYMGIKIALRGDDEPSRALAKTLVAAMVVFLVGGLFEPVFIHHLDTIFFSLLAMIAALWCSAFPDARFPGSGLRLTGRSQRP
jgi:O-antigen ligase